VLTQDTDFSRDVSGRYVCNTFTEAIAKPARSLFPSTFRILPALGLGVADATSIQDLRAAGNFGLDKPQKEVWGLPWHSPQKFPGLAYCIGGRSVYWGGWSPELLTSELPSAWPADVVKELRAIELVDGSSGYFSQASGQIGVTETNDFIFGDLHRALRAQLRDGLAAVTDAMPLGSLPDHPAVRFSKPTPTAAELLVMLGEPPSTTPSPLQKLKDELKLEAPLAVQGQSGHAGFFPFNKFSAVPLLMKAAREADSESKTDDVKKRLMVVARCRVNELKTATDGGKLHVTEVVTERGPIFVPPNGVVIIALGTIESTRLAQHSLQSLPPVGALGVLTLLVVLLLPDVDRSVRETKTFTARAAEFRRGLAEVLRTPPIFVAAGIEAVMYLGYGAFLGFLPIYAKKVGLNDAEIAIVFGAQLTLAMVAKPIAGRVSDRVGRIPVIVVGLLLCAAALPLIFRSESLTVFLLAAPLLGVGVGAVTPVTNALIADLSSARRLGAAMGVFGTIWDIGEAAGPMIAGFLIGDLGYARTFDVLAVVIALVTVGVMALVRDPKAAAAHSEPDRPIQ
jgi:hypothetical protein